MSSRRIRGTTVTSKQHQVHEQKMHLFDNHLLSLVIEGYWLVRFFSFQSFYCSVLKNTTCCQEANIVREFPFVQISL